MATTNMKGPYVGSEDDDVEALADVAMFQEPEGYFRPEKSPTFAEHVLLTGEKVRLRLVGHNPLWGHLLWNAVHLISEYLQKNAESLVLGKDVLELGAGAGLPGLVSAILGAKKVLITDYPDDDLIKNLWYNIQHCKALVSHKNHVSAQGYLWGAPMSIAMSPGFDLLILADLLFNHSEHKKLLSTIRTTLRRNSASTALVFFTPYRPWLLEKDLNFFELAKQDGFIVDKVLEHVMEKVMFEEDRGDELLRRTVFGYALRWPI